MNAPEMNTPETNAPEMNVPETTVSEQLPPCPPPPPAPPVSYAKKLLLIGLQCLLLLMGAITVWLLVDSRESTSNEVAESISSEWGGNVDIAGPVAKQVGANGHGKEVMPATFDCAAIIKSQTLYRNIYEAEVFDSEVTLSGTFSRSELMSPGGDPTVTLTINTPAKEIEPQGALDVAGKKYSWTRTVAGLVATVDIADMPEVIPFSTRLKTRGSGAFYVNRVGRRSSVTISGEARNPSFQGSTLPDERTVGGNTFSASWQSKSTQALTTPSDNRVGLEFLVGVDRYQKVSRSLKYSLIFVVLTFIMVLITEIRTRRRIPLLNYLLIGAALILFYVLLLAFSEIVAFGIAYTVAAAMTIALISLYLWKMLDSSKVGLTASVILSVLYASCYVMLCVTTYALLIGSLILFAALAASMFYSLKIK